jgi:ATP-binding cassette subfamily B protein
MYFIAKGECETLVKDLKSDNEQFVALLLPGCHFGELSLIYNIPRTATVRALNFVTVASLDKEAFTGLLRLYPMTLK